MKISGTQLSRDKLFRKSTDLKDATTAWKVSKYGIFSGTLFLYSDWILENTGQKNLRIWTLFTQCTLLTVNCTGDVFLTVILIFQDGFYSEYHSKPHFASRLFCLKRSEDTCNAMYWIFKYNN